MNTSLVSAPSSVWTAAALTEPPVDALAATIEVDSTWHPLGQSWRARGPELGFQPGWARIGWHRSALVYEMVFHGLGLSNSARELNEFTWETGDVCEVFVQADGAPFYLEIHITPENQRLQLRFTNDGLADVRAGRALLWDFMIADPDWVRTETRLTRTHLNVRAIIPAPILGLRETLLDPTAGLRTAVCRYDYRSRRTNPILSSTAALSEPFFHQRDAWHALSLLPPAET